MVKKTLIPMICLAIAAFVFCPMQPAAQTCPMAKGACLNPESHGWIQLFDGNSLDGWKKTEENQDIIQLSGGKIVCKGKRAHLFYDGDVLDHNFKNFELEVDVMTSPGSNGGIFIHTQYQPEGWPSKGYEIQVNNSYDPDPRKTGSIWGIVDVLKAPAKDNEWFTEHIVVLGDHVTVYIIDKKTGKTKKVVDYIEPADQKPPKKLSSGTIALQSHPGATVTYSNVRIRPLPDLPDWQPLFNGKNLDGWVQHNGKAKYEVEDNTIVGTTVEGSANSFLCTEKNYGDFELEYQVKDDPRLNAGVQIRSESLKSYNNGRVHGYQVEIDPSDRAWSGGIYDEARRGWLCNLVGNDPARHAFHNGEWNTYRVLCVGDSIRTWLNGVPAADITDGMTLSGFIGLQVHQFHGDTPAQISWRNLRLRDLSSLNKCCANGTCPMQKK